MDFPVRCDAGSPKACTRREAEPEPPAIDVARPRPLLAGIESRSRGGNEACPQVGGKGRRVFSALVAVAGVRLLDSGQGREPEQQSPLALPRAETLYMSGKQWGPYTNFNPLRPDYNTGPVGLLYETLFRYDPLKDKFIPWLATDEKWVGKNHVVTLRKGVTWNDGKPLTAADVKFTFETGKLAGSQYSTMWKTGLTRITTRGNVVTFHFRGTPNYQEWDFNMYSIPIVPRHVWSKYSATEITTGNTPTALEAGRHRSVHVRRGRRQLPDAAVQPARRLVGDEAARQEHADEVHRRHPQHVEHGVAAELPSEQDRPQQQLLPGHRQADRREDPHVLHEGAVHALREHGLARPEHDEGAAQRPGVPPGAGDVDQPRTRSSRPTTATSSRRRTRPGSLPTVVKWIDKAQVKKLGFKYNVAGAKALLAANGYRDTNGDGFVENKDGSHDQPPDHRPERLVGLDDRDPDHRRLDEGGRHQAHAGIPRLQRARRGAQLGQVRSRHQQREGASATRRTRTTTTSSTCRSPSQQTIVELLALHAGGREAVGAHRQDEQDQVHRRGGGEAGPLADPDGSSSSSSPRFRSGTTACGRSTTRPSGPTSRAPRARGCRTRHRRGTATST